MNRKTQSFRAKFASCERKCIQNQALIIRRIMLIFALVFTKFQFLNDRKMSCRLRLDYVSKRWTTSSSCRGSVSLQDDDPSNPAAHGRHQNKYFKGSTECKARPWMTTSSAETTMCLLKYSGGFMNALFCCFNHSLSLCVLYNTAWITVTYKMQM